MTGAEVRALVEREGVVLASARGPVTSLAERIVGGAIRGSWWAHPRAHEIFECLGAVHDSPDVLCCKLVRGKVTFVHRRLWPALLRLAPEACPPLDRVREEHTPSGKHVTHTEPWPGFLPRDVAEAAQRLSPEGARSALGTAAAELDRAISAANRSSSRRRKSRGST